jgi:hypothetical protein
VCVATPVFIGVATMSNGALYAQAVGQIIGTVTDRSGAVIPGVTVTVAGASLQQPLTAVTTQTGTYSFPQVPIGTYSLTFELSGFKKVTRAVVIPAAGPGATVDMTLEVDHPLVDTKRTTTGGDFTIDQLLRIPTARDPFQVMNMAPAIVLSGVNVGGSASGQQLTPAAFGQSGSVQWNLEGGSITDMSANASPMYFNFDSFQEIQVITGGGDVSVQSAGVFINLITKSGSNVVKGAADMTFEGSAMQGQNVTEAQFNSALTNGTGLSGDPLHRIANYDGDIGGPIRKNKLWYWASSDYQDIDVGDANFFDTALAGCNPPPSAFAQLSAVQGCLENDTTTIQDFNGKLNFLLDTTNKFQFLFQSSSKLRNNRGASSIVAPEATASQYGAGGIWHLQNPMYRLTHTWLPGDKLVFVNRVTYVQSGFFLDYHDHATCGSSSYARDLAGQDPTDPTCAWNIQSLSNSTTNLTSRAPAASYQTARPSWEVKTDDTYFLPHVLGGDHALKFGVGWRKNPVLTFSHHSGDAQDTVMCVNNSAAQCGDGVTDVPVGSEAGLVPRLAVLWRDSLTNHDWWTWDSYIQDSYTTRRLTVSGGVRQDYQNSEFLGGCVSANVILPWLFPRQCQGAVSPNHPFDNLSPRVSATDDLTGHGTTALHASYSYYFQTEEVLADGFNDLTQVSATFGPNENSGSCNPLGASCWTDANHDGRVQANELMGNPAFSSDLFANGTLVNPEPTIDPDLKLNRTRETVIGADHQVARDLHVAVDYTHRYTDLGATPYIFGTQPGTAAFPISNLWVGPFTFTDPQTGISAPYFVVCAGCEVPDGSTITSTSLTHQTYNGASVTLTKRLSHRWQGNISYTWNDFRGFTPPGTFNTATFPAGDPTGISFTGGFTNNTPRYTVKGYASVEMPWYGLSAAANWNLSNGNVRTLSINGPGTIANCPPGTAAAQCTEKVTYNTLTFQSNGSTRLPAIDLLDLSGSKTFDFGRQRLTVTLNCFNALNINTVTAFQSDVVSNNGQNGALNTFNAISSLVPPRVFRIDLRYAF